MSHSMSPSAVAWAVAALALTTACNRASAPAAAPAAGPDPAAASSADAAPPPAEVASDATPVTALPDDVSAAMDQLQARLKQRLVAELDKAGPAAAAEVCRSEAPQIAAALQREGLRLGRTSHQLRSSANEAPAWASAWVKAQGGRKVAAGPKLAAVALPGGATGYLRVIGTAPLCLTCHGPAEGLDPSLKATLAKGYPLDRATGFAENDVRGWFWAERAAPAK